MAEMLPVRTERELQELAQKSPAELRVYRACLLLPDDWVVLHGLRTLTIEAEDGARDREGDFVVLHPGYGLLVIEVKGGKVARRNGRWTRTLENTTKRIRDPFEQAVIFKHTLLRRLHANMRWSEVDAILGGARELARHCVLLPDVVDTNVVRGPQIEQEILGGSAAVDSLQTWVERAFRFGAEPHEWARLLTTGVSVVKDVLCQDFDTEAILGFVLEESEHRRLRLTREQFIAACELRTAPALAVVGGAGTGKTVLAFAHATDTAKAGLRTLLLCYNRPLADFLGHERSRIVKAGEVLEEHLVVNTFDGFSAWVAAQARALTGEDYLLAAAGDYPGITDSSVIAAIAMEYALDDHQLEPTFDIVLIDEGQDMGDQHWIGLRRILERARRWAVFLDPNQAVYRKATRSPIFATGTEQLFLTRNCRNTDPVHALAYRYYDGEPEVEQASLDGPAISLLSAPNLDGQAKRVVSAIRRWVAEEQVRPQQVAILVLNAPTRNDAWQVLESAASRAGLEVANGRHGVPGMVLFDSVQRFKGLEADIVVVWINGPTTSTETHALLYVGCSRAKTLLALLGNSGDLDGFS